MALSLLSFLQRDGHDLGLGVVGYHSSKRTGDKVDRHVRLACLDERDDLGVFGVSQREKSDMVVLLGHRNKHGNSENPRSPGKNPFNTLTKPLVTGTSRGPRKLKLRATMRRNHSCPFPLDANLWQYPPLRLRMEESSLGWVHVHPKPQRKSDFLSVVVSVRSRVVLLQKRVNTHGQVVRDMRLGQYDPSVTTIPTEENMSDARIDFLPCRGIESL